MEDKEGPKPRSTEILATAGVPCIPINLMLVFPGYSALMAPKVGPFSSFTIDNRAGATQKSPQANSSSKKLSQGLQERTGISGFLGHSLHFPGVLPPTPFLHLIIFLISPLLVQAFAVNSCIGHMFFFSLSLLAETIILLLWDPFSMERLKNEKPCFRRVSIKSALFFSIGKKRKRK